LRKNSFFFKEIENRGRNEEYLKIDNQIVFFKSSEQMAEIPDESIDLIITSPPYYDYKDYGIREQIGKGEPYDVYMKRLFNVFKECDRVLKPDGKLCINITDILRNKKDGVDRRHIIPLGKEIVVKMSRETSLDFWGEIIWAKTEGGHFGILGGKPLFGSYPYPTNFIINQTILEPIYIFRKFGNKKKYDKRRNRKEISKEILNKSKLTKEEWREFTHPIWHIPAVKQQEHIAMFPEELCYRLIRLFSFYGDIVLDPFLGSGTTLKVARNLGRYGVGYEINKNFKSIISKKIKEDLKMHRIKSISYKRLSEF